MEFNINTKLDEDISTEIAREVLKKSMNAMRTEAIQNASKNSDTGEIISKIQLNVISEDEIDLESLAPYSAPMEYGSSPHWVPIAPLKKWAGRKLGDEDIGYAVRAKIAKEGTTAHPFFRPALDVTQSVLLPQIIIATKAKYN